MKIKLRTKDKLDISGLLTILSFIGACILLAEGYQYNNVFYIALAIILLIVWVASVLEWAELLGERMKEKEIEREKKEKIKKLREARKLRLKRKKEMMKNGEVMM